MKFCACFAATILMFSSLSDSQCHGGLIAHWTGDNTAVDATGNGHDGTVNGATYAGGVVGDAFSFDGINDSVIVDADPDLESATISISLWVQSVLENHLRILVDSTHGAGQAGWALQLNTANNVSFAYGNSSTFPEVVAQSNIGDGKFHHIAATLDGTTMRLYVDGTLESTLGYTGTPAPSTRDIQLGNSLALSNRAFEGLLDEVRIYDHVLDQTEITNLSSVPEPATVGLVALASLALSGCRRRLEIV